jgi:hypothetical protein
MTPDNLTFQILAVCGVLLGIALFLTISFALITRLRLKNPMSQIVLSAATGLIFGLGSLALILLSEKFNDWNFLPKLTYAGKISIFVFIIVLILTLVRVEKTKGQE